MHRAPIFCRYQEDLDGCRGSLVDAWRNGSVGQHCIIEGLQADCGSCRQVLLESLNKRSTLHKGTKVTTPALDSQAENLGQAFEAVVLHCYPLKIRAVADIFRQAYYKLMYSIIKKYGYRDEGVPSADDVYQEAFVRLHGHLLKQKRKIESLTGYVIKVTVYTCINPGFGKNRVSLVHEEQVKEERGPSAALVPLEVVENWEDLDRRLLDSDQGNLINRIILAQQCVEACHTGKKPSAKQLHADWQTLWQMSKGSIASLHEKTVKHLNRSPASGLVHTAADVVNAGLAEPYQAAVIFAAGTGWDIEQTYRLLDELRSLSDSAIYARICRIYMALQPPWRQEGNEK